MSFTELILAELLLLAAIGGIRIWRGPPTLLGSLVHAAWTATVAALILRKPVAAALYLGLEDLDRRTKVQAGKPVNKKGPQP